MLLTDGETEQTAEHIIFKTTQEINVFKFDLKIYNVGDAFIKDGRPL